MARYTTQLGNCLVVLESLSGTGKELEKRPYAPVSSPLTNVRNFQNTVYNYKRNKNFVTCTHD